MNLYAIQKPIQGNLFTYLYARKNIQALLLFNYLYARRSERHPIKSKFNAKAHQTQNRRQSERNPQPLDNDPTRNNTGSLGGRSEQPARPIGATETERASGGLYSLGAACTATTPPSRPRAY